MNTTSALYKRFERISAEYPQDKSVIYNNHFYTYSELNQKANKLSHFLLSLKIRNFPAVGLYLAHGMDIPLSVLAVHKAGAYYVPLSINDSKEKINQILENCNCRIVICNTDFHDNPDVELIDLRKPELWQNYDCANPDFPVDKNDLAYILYTSGTTGKPKGVMVNHGNLSYYIDWYIQNLLPKLEGELSFTSSFTFAAAVTQLYVPLVQQKSLTILPHEISRNSVLLFDWFRQNSNFGFYVVPSLWEEHLITAKRKKVYPPKFLILTGEAASKQLIRESFEVFNHLKIWNLYGPTETVANISYSEILKNQPVTIGKIIKGSSGLVIDKQMNNTHTGELVVNGPGVSPGYLNRNELNKKQFITIGGKRYYRTGDRVKICHDGTMTFLGRKDRQIKINGVRIEPESIENEILSIDGIRKSLVLSVNNQGIGKKLTAFVQTSKNASESELNKKILEKLPLDKVVFVDNFPQLSNGKTDIKKLISKYENTEEKSKKRSKTITALLLKTINELLNIKISEDDNFFESGLSSMVQIRFINRLNLLFEYQFQMKEIYQNPSVRYLAYYIETKKITLKRQVAQIKNTFPDKGLSINQKTLWIAHQTKKVGHSYNIIFSIEMKSTKLNFDKIQNAIYKITDENDMLRSRFAEKNGKVQRLILKSYSPDILSIKIDSINEKYEIIESLNTNLLEEQDKTPVRYAILHYNSGTYELIVIINHLLFDGNSINIFTRKLIKSLDKESSPEPENTFTYDEYVVEQNEKIKNGVFNEGINYQVNRLKSNSYFLNLPTDFPRPKNQSFDGDTFFVEISETNKQNWITFSKKNHLSLFQFLISGFSMLLHQYSHQEDLLVSFPYSGRNNLYMEKTIGYFVNVIVFRSTVKQNDTFLDYIIRCKKNILEDSVYWDVPLEEIYPKLDVQVDPSSNPLFQVMFAFQEKTVEGISPSDIIYKTTEIPNNSSKLDIFLEAQDKTDGLLLKFNYATSLFTRNKIERFASDFIKIVNLIQKEPATSVKSLSLITSKELSRIKQWNHTTYELTEKLVIYDLFSSTAKKHQSKIAVRTPSEDYSYKQLNDRVLKFASKLVSNGINRTKPVGISMFPGIDMVTTLLSLSRLGVPFVPLDPSYPETHISYIISHSNLSHIITDDINRHISPETKIISHQTPESYTDNIQDITPNENDDLYIIFTSGSTGKPKGVPATNKSVANLLIWLRNKMEISPEDVFLFQSSINFDISMVEIFLPLITGGSLVITEKEEIKLWDHIHDIIRDFEITILQFVPSALWAFLATAHDNYVSSLRFTITGGEPLTPELKKAFLKKIDCKLVNLYGPTEGTIYVSGTDCNPDADSVTIGKPVFNTKIHILNRNLNQVPIGFKGDIYISGIGVTRGYFNNEKETKKHFFYHKALGVRLFKTGDTGSFREDGNIEFWGREDRQVKIRGFRIELSQVEAALEKNKEIKKVCVLIHQVSDTDKRLIAFYTSQNGAFPASSLRKIISHNIPAYMIPSEFYHLKEFSKLPNGKIDTQKLLANIDNIRNKKPTNNKELFVNNIERKIKEIWEQVLGKNNFSRNDNFFDVGGHSLLILEVKELIEKKLNKSVALTDLYKYGDIKSLAAVFMEDESNRTLINEIRQRVAHRRRQQKVKSRN